MLELGEVLGGENPADLSTSYLDPRTMDKHVERLMGRYVNGRPSSAPELRNICLSWAQCAEGDRETRTSGRAVVEAELQDWITTQSVEVAGQAGAPKAVGKFDKHVPIKQCKYPQEEVNASGNNTAMQCHMNNSTIRSWREDSRPGEGRGQFLTRTWREILKVHPTIDQDRQEFAEQVEEEERSQLMKSARNVQQWRSHNTTTNNNDDPHTSNFQSLLQASRMTPVTLRGKAHQRRYVIVRQ